MKEGTAYAVRLKKGYERFRQTSPQPTIPDADDPVRRLAIAILGVSCGDAVAGDAVDQLLSVMVDWNEVRISNTYEVKRAMGDAVPDGLSRAQLLIHALQCIYHHENRMSLDRLESVGRREAREYLEGLDGVDEYAVASVLLWSLGGHAIPVDNRLLQSLRDADLVHPAATRSEVQAFLERHVSATDAREFCLIMSTYAADQGTTAKRGTEEAPRMIKNKKTT